MPFTNLLESVFHKGVSAMPRILIVDDDATFRTTPQALLEDVECECRVVKSGAEKGPHAIKRCWDVVSNKGES